MINGLGGIHALQEREKRDKALFNIGFTIGKLDREIKERDLRISLQDDEIKDLRETIAVLNQENEELNTIVERVKSLLDRKGKQYALLTGQNNSDGTRDR